MLLHPAHRPTLTLADMDEPVGRDDRANRRRLRQNTTPSRGPSYSSYQALKAMALDELEGKLLAGLLAPYGDEPTPNSGADR